MNKNIGFYVGAGLTVLVLALIVIGVSAAGGQGILNTSSAAQIPPALVTAFNGVVLALTSAAFVWLFSKIGLDLTSLSIPFSISLSTFLLGLVQGWINLQPISSDQYIMVFLNILLVVLTGTGGLALLAKHRGGTTIL